MWVATAAESREIDRVAGRGLPEGELIRRAAEAALQVCLLRFTSAQRILVLAGPGNNGSDAILLASLLQQAGRQTSLLLVGRPTDGGLGVQLNRSGDLPDPSEFDLCIDGIFGTGLNRPVTGLFQSVIERLNLRASRILSLDIPSGVQADTGAILGEAVKASCTVEFIVSKRARFCGEGQNCYGAPILHRLQVPAKVVRQQTSTEIHRAPLGLKYRNHDSHKGDNGSVLIVAGSRRYRGAAHLACLGALRAGAGYVQLATVACVVESVVSALPEVLVHTLPEADGVVAPEAVGHIRDMRYDSLVVGPGLGDAESFLSGFLPKLRAPACVDADALNWLARSGASLSEDLVLTPHEGEAARLLRISREEVAADRFGAVASLSDKYQCFAVLKGSHTLTRTPQGKTVINPTGNSGMATAGMGDVLSGMIGAALASSAWSGLSVAAMVHLHGLAGDLCANEIGPYGYTASELAARIPKARAKLMPCPVHGSLSR